MKKYGHVLYREPPIGEGESVWSVAKHADCVVSAAENALVNFTSEELARLFQERVRAFSRSSWTYITVACAFSEAAFACCRLEGLPW